MAQLNIYEYFQGWDHGPTVDGDCCGFPLLPLHKDHRQLLRGCASEDNDSWWMPIDCFSSFGSHVAPDDCVNSEKQVELDNWPSWQLCKLVTISPRCWRAPSMIMFWGWSMTQMVQYGRLEEHPAWVMILVKVNHVLLTINSATNIVIYSYKVQQWSFWL